MQDFIAFRQGWVWTAADERQHSSNPWTSADITQMGATVRALKFRAGSSKVPPMSPAVLNGRVCSSSRMMRSLAWAAETVQNVAAVKAKVSIHGPEVRYFRRGSPPRHYRRRYYRRGYYSGSYLRSRCGGGATLFGPALTRVLSNGVKTLIDMTLPTIKLNAAK